jgi:transposase InsO family protein
MPPKKMSELLRAIGVDPAKKEVKLQQAPAIKQKDKGKFKILKPFAVVQADLIYMPDDKGYRYILTVVDVGSRHVDAVPLKGRESEDVIEGFETIFKRKYIPKEKVATIYTDPGAEFKNENFVDYMDDHDIVVRHSMTNRHQQMGVVEYYNHLLTKSLGTKMTAETLETKNRSTSWVKDVPKLIKKLNEKSFTVEKPDVASFFTDPPLPDKRESLQVGSVVRVRLQQPKDVLTGKRLHGTFRNSDVRWEQDLTEITSVLMLPAQKNVRYMVKKYNNVSFIKKELMEVTEEEARQYRQGTVKKVAKKPAPKKQIVEPTIIERTAKKNAQKIT